MRVVKFTINENYYNDFKEICTKEEITVKKKLNVLLAHDKDETVNIRDYFPKNHNEALRSVTLKINEELYKGFLKKCGKMDIKASKYVPYLIYRFLMK